MIRARTKSVLVGYKKVTPIWRLALVQEHIGAAPLCNLELRRKAFQSTQTWSTLALDEHAVARTYVFAHVLHSGYMVLNNPEPSLHAERGGAVTSHAGAIRDSVVAVGGVVTRDVPLPTLAAGVPMRVIRDLPGDASPTS